MRYPNPHQQYGVPAMTPMQNLTIQQQQQQMAQLQQQMLQQQLMNNAAQVNPMQQQQMMITNALSRNPQMAMMVQQNPQLLSNPQFIQQLLASVQMQQPMMIPQQQAGIQQGTFQQQQQVVPQLQSDSYTGRFGGTNQIQQQPQQQPVQQQVQSQPVQTESVPVKTPIENTQVSVGIPEFAVNDKENISFFNNTRFTIKPKTSPFQQSMMDTTDVIAVEDLDSAIQHLIEKAGGSKKNVPFINMNAVIYDCTFKVQSTETLNKLFTGDVRQLYKTLKIVYNEAKSVEDVIMAERVNAYLTSTVNHYLRVTLNDSVSIGSFVEDFNDLLKVLRNNFEDAEDDLRDYVQEEIEEIAELMEGRVDELKTQFHLTEGVTIVYYADHHASLGIAPVDNIVKLTDAVSNAMLIGLAKFIFTDSQRNKFYLVTYDRRMYIMSKNKDEEIFIEFVEAK